MPSPDPAAGGGPERSVVCKVLSRLGWDGAYHEPGATVELPPDVAESLEAIGAVEPQEDAVAVADAIRQLDRGNPEHFTKAGRPHIPAISAIVGRPVTGAERDAAWAEIEQAEGAQ